MAALLPELDVRTVLNVVEENFQKANLKAYAIRMIYTGEHTLPKQEIIKQFKKSVQGVNTGYCEINVRGLLLVYDSYFVHIIEVDWIEEATRLDEEAHRAAVHAAELAAADGLPVVPVEPLPHQADRKMLNRMKILMVYHSIKTLLFDDWHAVTAHPPSLVGKLDVFGPLEEHMEQLRICLDKISKLCQLAKLPEPLSFDGLRAADPKMEVLPEVALLDYLLQSQYILDLRHTLHLHRHVDDYCFYFESVWPLPTHYTPRLLYKLKVDDTFVEQLPVMPWELVKKEVAEDEEREEHSESDSSD